MHEVDYLWVGEKSNTGDAITLRFSHPTTGEDTVVIIDGGFRETGDRIADHVENHYGRSRVDLVVCTHPDDDHIMGLFAVFKRLSVARLLIHRPVFHGFSGDDLKSGLVEELVSLAEAQGTAIDYEVFAGSTYFAGAIAVAGPSQDFYVQQLQDQRALTASMAGRFSKSAPGLAAEAVRGATRSLTGDPGETMVGDNGGTTPRNNSSIILDVQIENKRILFTGDAGAPALTAAADRLDLMRRSGREVDLFDIPHHGSRHNVTPELLDRLLGAQTQELRGHAVVSVGKLATDHPRAEVANAVRRRGYPVCCTRGVSLWWHSDDAPVRWDYDTAVTPIGCWTSPTTSQAPHDRRLK